MKFYDYKKIDEMVQTLIKMMQKEYPNDAQLTIDSNSAKIQYVHEELMFLESLLMPNKGDENGLKNVFFSGDREKRRLERNWCTAAFNGV